jgi:hypothetical protein
LKPDHQRFEVTELKVVERFRKVVLRLLDDFEPEHRLGERVAAFAADETEDFDGRLKLAQQRRDVANLGQFGFELNGGGRRRDRLELRDRGPELFEPLAAERIQSILEERNGVDIDQWFAAQKPEKTNIKCMF